MTYAELVQKIRDYTEVGSEVLTSTIVNGFIRDSEFKIFRKSICRLFGIIFASGKRVLRIWISICFGI